MGIHLMLEQKYGPKDPSLAAWMKRRNPEGGWRGSIARGQARALAARMLVAAVLLLLLVLGAGPVLRLQGPALIAVELAALASMIVTDRVYEPRFGRWLRGGRGEESVGVVLAGLEPQEWHAIHDVSLGRGNVDHVAVGPGGIFAIETKSHRGRIPIDRVDRRWLKQAYAERNCSSESPACRPRLCSSSATPGSSAQCPPTARA